MRAGGVGRRCERIGAPAGVGPANGALFRDGATRRPVSVVYLPPACVLRCKTRDQNGFRQIPPNADPYPRRNAAITEAGEDFRTVSLTRSSS